MRTDDDVLPLSEAESARLERQAELFGGVAVPERGRKSVGTRRQEESET